MKKYYSIPGCILEAIIISVAICCAISYQPRKECIGTVDVNNIIKHYTKITAQSQIDNAALEEKTKGFAQQLEKEIAQVAQEKKVTLLVAEAVLAGSIDYTHLIQKRMEHFYPDQK